MNQYKQVIESIASRLREEHTTDDMHLKTTRFVMVGWNLGLIYSAEKTQISVEHTAWPASEKEVGWKHLIMLGSK